MSCKKKCKPLITVIVPVYNTNVLYLQECIDGVKGQNIFEQIELLLINDCSTDVKTIQYLQCIEKQGYENIRVIHLPKNAGISASRNFGIDKAQGEWMCFLDHDDYWEKDYLEKFIDTAAHENVDILIGGYKLIDEAGKYINRFPTNGRKFASKYYPYSTSAPWNRLIRREFLINNCIYFPEGCLTEDIAFNLHCNACAKKIAVVESYGYCNRVNTMSASRSELFTSMPLEMMPFEAFEKLYELPHEETGEILDGAVLEVVTLLACLFCRRSSTKTISEAAKKSALLVRRNIRHYMIASIKFIINVESRISVKLMQLGFTIAIFLHMEKIYCLLVAKILSVIF